MKGYNEYGEYKGTYNATIMKYGRLLYIMKLSFFSISKGEKREENNYLKEKLLYSSSIIVLKRKFKEAIMLNVKTKIVWVDIYKKEKIKL
ncbi:hypothetical protein U8Y98_27000 [Priestia megaterium]|uniref:hypothetical protein n=1 Tax=Priestia megaterium TaxID=1404 RepID=UPI002FDFC186